MGRMGSFSTSDMRKFQQQLDKIRSQGETELFIEACAKELAARLLREVKKRTPVGEYSGGEYQCKVRKGPKCSHISAEVEGKNGGTLRRSWTTEKIRKEGSNYIVDIVNPRAYASYVEYGHRQEPGRYVPALGMQLKKGWVRGHFMMTISEQEIQGIAPRVLERKFKKFLGECFK